MIHRKISKVLLLTYRPEIIAPFRKVRMFNNILKTSHILAKPSMVPTTLKYCIMTMGTRLINSLKRPFNVINSCSVYLRARLEVFAVYDFRAGR